MHRLVLLTAFVFGCADNALPTDNNGGGTNGATTAGTTGSTTAGGTTAGGTTAGGTTAGSTTAGSTTAGGTTGTTGTTGSTGGTTGGPAGSPCKTACDCMTGLACFQNSCQPSQMFQLFCCDSSNCPSGQVCQGSDGSFGMCGNSTTGGPGACKTACDCPNGEACFNGGCIMPPMGALYCCSMCPSSGGFCQASDGSFGQCGGGMTTGGTSGGTMCQATMCMSSTDCTKVGCNNGCSMRTHTCR